LSIFIFTNYNLFNRVLGREFFVKRSLIPPSKLVLGIEFLNVPFTENYVMWNDNNCAPPESLVYSWVLGTVVNNPRMRYFVPGSRRNPINAKISNPSFKE